MIDAPTSRYAALAPMLILFGAACVGVLVEAFVPRDVPAHRRRSRRPGRHCSARWSPRWSPSSASAATARLVTAAARSPSTGRPCSCRARSRCSACCRVLLIAERASTGGRSWPRPRSPRAADATATADRQPAADRGLPAGLFASAA